MVWVKSCQPKYFVTIEIYDFSVSEDEVLSLKDGSKQTQTTRLGLQVRFTNAENGTYFVGSGLGEKQIQLRLKRVCWGQIWRK